MKKITFIMLLSTITLNAKFVTIGTAGVSGTYYFTGKVLCDFLNNIKKTTKISCLVESTGGSVDNIKLVQDNEIDFAIAQSDVIYQANINNKNINNLKSVISIYPELFTLVTREDSGILNYNDLKNKRVNIGNIGSGNEATALTLFKSIGFNKKELLLESHLKSSEMSDALINNKIDAYFYMIGHPSLNIIDVSNTIKVKLIPLSQDKLNILINNNPYFVSSTISGGLYKNNPNNILTFSVKAVLLVNKNVSDELVYNLLKQLFDNFDEFKKSHRAYKDISKKSLLEGLILPMHDGAKKYFIEKGYSVTTQ